MGVDFLKSKCKPFDKAWDTERTRAARDLLSTVGISAEATSIMAKSLRQGGLQDGDEVLVRADGDRLTVLVDLATTAVLVDPAARIVSAIRESGGYAHGRIEADPILGLVKV